MNLLSTLVFYSHGDLLLLTVSAVMYNIRNKTNILKDFFDTDYTPVENRRRICYMYNIICSHRTQIGS